MHGEDQSTQPEPEPGLPEDQDDRDETARLPSDDHFADKKPDVQGSVVNASGPSTGSTQDQAKPPSIQQTSALLTVDSNLSDLVRVLEPIDSSYEQLLINQPTTFRKLPGMLRSFQKSQNTLYFTKGGLEAIQNFADENPELVISNDELVTLLEGAKNIHALANLPLDHAGPVNWQLPGMEDFASSSSDSQPKLEVTNLHPFRSSESPSISHGGGPGAQFSRHFSRANDSFSQALSHRLANLSDDEGSVHSELGTPLNKASPRQSKRISAPGAHPRLKRLMLPYQKKKSPSFETHRTQFSLGRKPERPSDIESQPESRSSVLDSPPIPPPFLVSFPPSVDKMYEEPLQKAYSDLRHKALDMEQLLERQERIYEEEMVKMSDKIEELQHEVTARTKSERHEAHMANQQRIQLDSAEAEIVKLQTDLDSVRAKYSNIKLKREQGVELDSFHTDELTKVRSNLHDKEEELRYAHRAIQELRSDMFKSEAERRLVREQIKAMLADVEHSLVTKGVLEEQRPASIELHMTLDRVPYELDEQRSLQSAPSCRTRRLPDSMGQSIGAELQKAMANGGYSQVIEKEGEEFEADEAQTDRILKKLDVGLGSVQDNVYQLIQMKRTKQRQSRSRSGTIVESSGSSTEPDFEKIDNELVEPQDTPTDTNEMMPTTLRHIETKVQPEPLVVGLVRGEVEEPVEDIDADVLREATARIGRKWAAGPITLRALMLIAMGFVIGHLVLPSGLQAPAMMAVQVNKNSAGSTTAASAVGEVHGSMEGKICVEYCDIQSSCLHEVFLEHQITGSYCGVYGWIGGWVSGSFGSVAGGGWSDGSLSIGGSDRDMWMKVYEFAISF